MVLGLRLLEVFVIFWSSFHRCRALDDSVLPWRLDGGNETSGPAQLVECDTLNISLSPETSNAPREDTSYVLAFEPGGTATMSLGDAPSSLRWIAQHSAGTRLFVALLDSFGTSLGVLPDMYTVIRSKDCLTKSELPSTVEATEPKITPPAFGHFMPCGPSEISLFEGKPYSVSIVALESGNFLDYSMSSGEHILPYTRSGGELSGKAIVIISDANGVLGTMNPILDLAAAKNTPSAGTSESFSRCRLAQPSDLTFHSREPLRPTPSRLRRNFSDHPHMQLSPARAYTQRGRKGRHKARREEIPTRIGSLGAGTAPIPTTTTSSQSKPGSSHDTRMQPRLSDTSLVSNRAGPSSYHTPPRSWTHPHTPIPPDPPSQSGSRAQPGQSPSSLPTGTQLQCTAGAPATRSASVQERRSAKHALWLSRSASELYRAASSAPRYLVPEYGSHPSSGGYANRHGGDEIYVNPFSRPTRHLRQWHSASPVVHVHHVRSDPEEDVGGAIILQHRDVGVMQELPPPYHKLV